MGAAEPADERARLEEALAGETAARRAAEEELAQLRQRMDNAQRLANMGDYDWHIPTDTNRWSDQLYRIYGHEPQSFNASYDRFLSLIHPEDRERITAIHQHAYATGQPYEMIERVVRPDGEVRYLRSNGQVVMGSDGAPERMRGTCVDITEQVLAEREREAAAARLSEVRLRRRQAAEINDNVVQGVTAAMYALELDDLPSCVT
jgi:PAS domain S-box-containing protein